MTEATWTPVVDSVEGAFSVELPTGWQADVRTLRVGPLTLRAVRAVSPDGATRLSLHDPDLPAFYEPSSGMMVTPGVHQLMPFVPAGQFLPQYLQQRFGAAPGFSVAAVVDEPDLVRDTVQRAAERGYQVRPTAASAEFSFTDQGSTVAALMMCSTTSFGPTWAADVFAVFAVGGSRPDRALLLHALRSERTNAQWQAGENQLFANQQAINQQQSNAWMATMQAGHNQRMGDIAAAGAANTAIHQQRVAMGIYAVVMRHAQRADATPETSELTSSARAKADAARALREAKTANRMRALRSAGSTTRRDAAPSADIRRETVA